MTISDGSQHRLQYIVEVTEGTTPGTPTFIDFPHNGLTGRLAKDELVSQGLDADRQYGFVRHGNKQVGASIPFELAYGSHDAQLEAVLGGTWSAKVDTGAITVDVAPSGSAATFTRSSGDYTADPIVAGDVITVTGFADAGGNGRFIATNVTATVITATPLEGQTVPTESGDADEQIIVDASLENGTTRRSFSFEEYFADQSNYIYSNGQNFSSVSLDISSGAIVNGVFTTIGKDVEDATGTQKSSTTNGAAGTAEPFDSFTGDIMENGSSLAIIQSLSLELDNQMERRNVVFSNTTVQPSIRRFMLTGTVNAYFDSIKNNIRNAFLYTSELADKVEFEQ